MKILMDTNIIVKDFNMTTIFFLERFFPDHKKYVFFPKTSADKIITH